MAAGTWLQGGGEQRDEEESIGAGVGGDFLHDEQQELVIGVAEGWWKESWRKKKGLVRME